MARSIDIDSDGELEIMFGNDDGIFYCIGPAGEVEFEFQVEFEFEFESEFEFEQTNLD